MARKPTTPEAVLAACQARVLAWCPVSLPSDADVWISLGDDDTVSSAPPHDRFVVIRPLAFRPDNGVVTGAGAGLFVSGGSGGHTGQIPLSMPTEVSLWVRLATDELGRDEDWLSNSTLGAMRLWRRVLGALQMFDPVDAGDKILTEPMRLADPGAAFGPRKRAIRDLGKLEAVFDIQYVAELLPAETP